MKQPISRLKWHDIKQYQIIEFVMDSSMNIKDATYVYFNEFIVLKGYYDVGLDKVEYQEVEFCIPSHAFIEAYNATPVSWRQEKPLKMQIQKLRMGKMKIVQMGNHQFVEGKWT